MITSVAIWPIIKSNIECWCNTLIMHLISICFGVCARAPYMDTIQCTSNEIYISYKELDFIALIGRKGHCFRRLLFGFWMFWRKKYMRSNRPVAYSLPRAILCAIWNCIFAIFAYFVHFDSDKQISFDHKQWECRVPIRFCRCAEAVRNDPCYVGWALSPIKALAREK